MLQDSKKGKEHLPFTYWLTKSVNGCRIGCSVILIRHFNILPLTIHCIIKYWFLMSNLFHEYLLLFEFQSINWHNSLKIYSHRYHSLFFWNFVQVMAHWIIFNTGWLMDEVSNYGMRIQGRMFNVCWWFIDGTLDYLNALLKNSH